MKQIGTRWVVLGCLWALGLCGCHPLGGGAVEQQGYLFTQPKVSALKTPLVAHILMHPVSVNPAFAGQLFVRRLPGGRYARDYQRIFFVSPGPQLTQIMHQSLSNAGISEEVGMYGVPKRGLMLRSEVSQLYIEEGSVDAHGAASSAVVWDWTVKVYRVDRPFHQHWVRTLHYHEKVPVQGQVINAMNTALQRIMTALVHDLQSYLKAHPMPVAVSALLQQRLGAARDGALDGQREAVLAWQLSRT